MAGLFNKVPTDLDINGPILSITTEPTGVTGIGTTVGATGGASVSITGVATAVVGSSGTGGTGYLSYQWYEEGVGALSNGTYITGTASTGAVGSTATLTLSNLVTPTDNNRKFYFEVDYVPSYTVGVQSVTVPGVRTGNAWNEPITSGVATVTVTPLIDIIAQPTNTQTLTNSTPNEHLAEATADVTVNADLSDNTFSDDLTYQWILNGEEATDGVKTVTTTTGSTTSGLVENYYACSSTHTFPSVSIEDVEITIAGARSGTGGLDGGGPGGGQGYGASGKFFFKDNSEWLGKTIHINTGQRGNDGSSSTGGGSGQGGSICGNLGGADGDGQGGRGGNAGGSGWSGGGGGGGANSYIRDSDGNKFLVAGGGGGGGGGSHNRSGFRGNDASSWSGVTGPLRVVHGQQGKDKSGDGGGGGGGGGGFALSGDPGAAGGDAGQDNSSGGRGGHGGKGAYDQSKISHIYHSGSEINFANNADGYVNLKYTGFTDTTQTIIKKTTISGSTTSTLRLSSDTVGVQTCMCKITSATASNSPIYTDTVNVVFNSTAEVNNVNVEGIGIGLTASLSTLNLANGDFTLQTSPGDVSTGQINNEWVFYSPDKDMDVEMDLYGGKGADATDNDGVTSSYQGGEGGYARIRFTMKQNEEYVIAGLTTAINAPFLYHKGTLIACVGQGGQAGLGAKGGYGGGLNISGAKGGNNGGYEGNGLFAGSLGANGAFGSAVGQPPLVYPEDNAGGEIMRDPFRQFGGGIPIKCTKGVYWAQQGYSACADVGTVKFRLSGGEEVTNTTDSITRGYKSGYNIIQTAGEGAVGINAARGGNGCRGGSGGGGRNGTPNNSGGGGGGGYSDGSITNIVSTAGGSTGDAKVVLRLQS